MSEAPGAGAGAGAGAACAFASLPTQRQVEALAALAREALSAWRLADARLELVKYRENAVFSVQTARERFALRVHRPGYRSDAHIRSEIAWMQALAETGIRTPEVVPTPAGRWIVRAGAPSVPEARQCDLLRWIAGTPLGTLESGVAGATEDVAATYRTLGELAARVHEHAAHWKPPDGFTRPAFDASALVGDTPVWGRFEDLACLTGVQREVLGRARDRTRAALEDFGTGADRYGLIHGDFLPENVLVHRGEPRLIDFDDCGESWYAFELATALFPLLQNGEPRAMAAAFLEGYRRHRAFPEAWLACMPTFLMARTLSYLGWPAGRPENREAQQIAPFLAEVATGLARRYLDGEPVGRVG